MKKEIRLQLKIEKKIERALLSDGYSPESLLHRRHQIRGILFYPQGRPFSEATYSNYLSYMENYGTHRSRLYIRIMDEVYKKELFL